MERSIRRRQGRQGARRGRIGEVRCGDAGLVLRREDRLPIIFHTDDNPAFGVWFVDSFIEAAHGGRMRTCARRPCGLCVEGRREADEQNREKKRAAARIWPDGPSSSELYLHQYFEDQAKQLLERHDGE